MKNLFLAGLLALLLVSVAAVAQSPFDGTWKSDLSSAQWPTKPSVYLLQNGMYDCKTCVPPIHVKADGTDQKVTDPYSDALSVKVIDDHNIENTFKKDGKVVFTQKQSVSSDGNTLTVNWTYTGNLSGGPQTGTETDKRVAKAPAGANLISGSWRTEKADVSAESLTYTFKVNGNELAMTNATGGSYTAKLDGTDAPVKGDPGLTSVSVKMLGKNTLEETYKRDGKVTVIYKSTVSSDGKTLKVVTDDKLQGTITKSVSKKQ
jgi:hypothetical protein